MKEPKQNRAVQLRICAVCFVLAMVLEMGMSVSAVEQTGSLRLDCTVESEGQSVCLSGDEYALVQVALAQVLDQDGVPSIQYQICPEYAEFDCDWSSLIASELRQKAKQVAEAAMERQEYFAVGTTDAEGQVNFDQLPPGLYLVIRTKAAPENAAYICEPFFASVPLIWDYAVVYEVIAQPKFSWDTPDESTDPTEPTKPSEPSVPQTGQTNWPVPAMAIGGTLLIAAGLWLRNEEKKREMTL